ncbi:unnamed protein product [Bemisia tabaci]|uniref:G-protein coupled receptors family 1 profile domain-containing protein n=1 Tax=Bemisia tabaci TaxID=7038 RepID=A0A9P0ALY2_BEMTA|nr:unnamed protein product [Bemisia tabaci]
MTPLEDLDAIPLDLFDPTNSSNLTCNNEYCLPDDEYVDRIKDYIAPSPFEWVLIFMHMCVFVVGLVGNALVCVAVYRNRAMRTITNYFIVNLAVADFMVILFCLPPTVVWDKRRNCLKNSTRNPRLGVSGRGILGGAFLNVIRLHKNLCIFGPQRHRHPLGVRPIKRELRRPEELYFNQVEASWQPVAVSADSSDYSRRPIDDP